MLPSPFAVANSPILSQRSLPLSQPILSQLLSQMTSASADKTQTLGNPPALTFLAHTLTLLDRARSSIPKGSMKINYVALLAAVIDMEVPHTFASGSIKTMWTLQDHTGATMNLVLWGQQGEVWSSNVRRGDIIYLSRTSRL